VRASIPTGARPFGDLQELVTVIVPGLVLIVGAVTIVAARKMKRL
jgi:hypothetical protein